MTSIDARKKISLEEREGVQVKNAPDIPTTVRKIDVDDILSERVTIDKDQKKVTDNTRKTIDVALATKNLAMILHDFMNNKAIDKKKNPIIRGNIEWLEGKINQGLRDGKIDINSSSFNDENFKINFGNGKIIFYDFTRNTDKNTITINKVQAIMNTRSGILERPKS